MKTYGKLRWFSEWKPDLSNLGHALEAGLVSAVCAPVVVWGAGELAAKTARVPVFSLEDAFLLTSFGMLCWYIGREKRDCETGMDLPAGSPKAWLFMWWRPKNILDMLGPIVVHLAAWVLYLQGGSASAASAISRLACAAMGLLLLVGCTHRQPGEDLWIGLQHIERSDSRV